MAFPFRCIKYVLQYKLQCNKRSRPTEHNNTLKSQLGSYDVPRAGVACCRCVSGAVDRAGDVYSPLQQQYYQHHNSFRPIVDAYSNSLTARSDVMSPQDCRQWSAATYLDDEEEIEAVWTDGRDGSNMMRHRYRTQPPAYSNSPPLQPVYRRPTPITSAPILRPDNYTLKRARPAPPAAVEDGPGESQVDTGGHLQGYLDEPATINGGDTTDSGYSLHRSTAPPSPAPLDNV